MVKLLDSLESLVVGSSVVVSSVAPLGSVSDPPMETEYDTVVVAETDTCADSVGLVKPEVAERSSPVATSVPVTKDFVFVESREIDDETPVVSADCSGAEDSGEPLESTPDDADSS